ncbi:MAG: type II secretion system secretin GspD [Micropepsaceae bacterium]
MTSSSVKSPIWRRASIAFVIALSATVGGCESSDDGEALRDAMNPAQMQAGASEATRPSSVVLSDEARDNDGQPKTEIFEGDNKFVNTAPRPRGSMRGGEVVLDFADAEVKDVVRTVLGDILKVPFSVDPQIQGKVTLKTSKPLRKQDVIAALETALKVNGAVIVLADNVYNVVPATEAQKRIDGFELSGSARSRAPGYGIEIVPLRYVAGAEMQKILEPVSPAGGVASVDAQRNLIFLAGTSQERAAMIDTIRLFDVDYMKGMSYALIRPEHVEAGALAQELTKVFQSTGGSSASLLRFVPLPRINTLLVVSPRSAQLQTVQKWVDRLDVSPRGPGRGVYYYRMQNAKAQDVARSLSAVYGNAVTLGPSETDNGDNGSSEMQPAAPAQTPSGPPPGQQQNAAPSNGGGEPGPQIAVDGANNALIVRASASEYAALERFLKEIDIAPDQVLIEVTIAEVTLNDSLRYGVEWFFKNADNQNFSLGRALKPAAVLPGFNFTYTIPDVDIALNALSSITDVQVISAPKLLTLDNKSASLQFGDQVPIITQTATGVRDATDPTIVNSVQFRDTGIVLRVTPRISKGGTVFVDVNQEVSAAIPTTSSGIDSPTIQQRKISSTVAVQDGDSIALGGMIRQSDTRSDSGVPVLKDIPLVGHIFSNTKNTGDRTELLIFLRPRIIRNAAAAREVTDQLKRGLRGLDVLMNGTNQP